MCYSGVASIFQAIGGGIAGQLGTAYSAIGQKKQYQYLEDSAKQQIEMDKAAAAVNISLTQDQAKLESAQLRRQTSKIEGLQKSTMAGQGIAGSVTAADIIKDTVTQSTLDQAALRYNAELKTYGIRSDLANSIYENQWKINQYSAAKKNVMKAATMSGVLALVGGSANAGGVANSIDNSIMNRARPTQNYATISGRGTVPVAPADYYKSHSTGVPSYLSLTR